VEIFNLGWNATGKIYPNSRQYLICPSHALEGVLVSPIQDPALIPGGFIVNGPCYGAGQGGSRIRTLEGWRSSKGSI